jgi:hypothetical protein
MSVISHAAKIYRKLTQLQYLSWIALVLAVATLLAIGFYLGRNSTAAVLRDCSENSISNNPESGGGCGALDPKELVVDLMVNKPSDLRTIFADSRVGLTTDMYSEFAADAQMGEITRDGQLVVDGQTVMTDVWTMGRTDLGGKQPTPIEIGGNTYFHSAPADSFGDGIDSLPAMALFDKHGTVKTAVLAPCANPVTKGKKVKSNAVCEKLVKTPVEGKKNTYHFTTEVGLTGLAEVVKVDYYVDEGDGPTLFRTEENPSTPVEIEFTRDASVAAVVTVSLPGKKTKVIESEKCVQHVKVEKKEVPPKEPKKPKPEQPKVKPAKVEKKAPPPPMPVTGPADAVGLFAGTSVAGAIGHRLYTILRERKQK